MDNTTNSLAEKSRLRQMIDSYGVPRMIITGFLLLMFVLVPFAGVDFATQISNVINRFSWNAIMVLAMVPMVHSGCGLNFGLPLGIISGLLGATLSIELGFTGPMSFVMAIAIATPFALLLGGGYGWLLNKIKGGEMMVATYVGFSSVSFMCMMWLLLPYKKPEMVWGFSGSGLRTTISLEGFYDRVLADILSIDLNRFGINLVIPTGSLIFFAILAFLMWAFLHTKTGTAMTAVGSNPSFAKAAGVSIDKMRLIPSSFPPGWARSASSSMSRGSASSRSTPPRSRWHSRRSPPSSSAARASTRRASPMLSSARSSIRVLSP